MSILTAEKLNKSFGDNHVLRDVSLSLEDGEFVCSFFFATNDNNYVHYVNYATFDPTDEDAKSTMIGIYLDSEKPEEDEE